MEEFRLSEARYEDAGVTIAFKRRTNSRPKATSIEELAESEAVIFDEIVHVPTPTVVNHGTPVSSPMPGIFYSSPSPSAPPFVKEGDAVTAGQIIGLIEAMKVFNEIPCSASGVVKKVVAESGQLVNPGDILLYVG